MKRPGKINIRPQVTMLSVLKYIEYETWYALAEFVDNAIASYLRFEKDIKKHSGDNFKLEVSIEFNDSDNQIIIRDNAAGIHERDYLRAFRTAEAPPDTSGLSEFGMGMKSAACWFSDYWLVRTSALGEATEKTICFDMKQIVDSRLEELEIAEVKAKENIHYTSIELFNVHRMPRKRGLTKVKDHLTSIYRQFIRNGQLILKIDNEVQFYREPQILKAAKYNDPDGEVLLWKKDICFEVRKDLTVHGFVAIRDKASTSEAGFSLFRKGRVIEGSFDDGFRPEIIFGNPNSFRYQRVFGELHLEGFEVVFTKKGIKWDDNLELFLTLLRNELSDENLPLLQQAERHRVRATEKEYNLSAKKVLENTTKDLEKSIPKAIEELRNLPNVSQEPELSELTIIEKEISSEFETVINEVVWMISIQLSYDPAIKSLIEIGNHFLPNSETIVKSVKKVGIRLSLIHPFMVEHVGTDSSKIDPILRIIAALGLSEVIAKESGAKTQGEIRRNFNELVGKLVKVK